MILPLCGVPVFGSSGRVGNHNEPLVNGPGIVIGRKGTVGSVFWSADPFYPIDTTYYISPDDSNLFLFHALKEMHLISTDAAVPGLNRNFAHSRQLVMPSVNILRRFLEFADSTYAQIQLLSRQTALLCEARDVLLPRLMRGELQP